MSKMPKTRSSLRKIIQGRWLEDSFIEDSWMDTGYLSLEAAYRIQPDGEFREVWVNA